MDTRTRFVIGLMTVSLLGTASMAGAVPLTDISTSPHKEAIEYLQEHDIITGYPDGSFHPDDTVNRAELVKILVGSLGIEPESKDYHDCFPDVTDAWFAPFVCFAKEKEWITGYPDGTFQPAMTVNAAEAIKMIVVALGYPLETSGVSPYTDVDPSAWYLPYVLTASKASILPTDVQVLGIGKFMTRGDVSEILYRAIIGRGSLDDVSSSESQEDSVSGSAEWHAVTIPPLRSRRREDVSSSSGETVSRPSFAAPAIVFSAITKKYGDPDFKLLPTSNSAGAFAFTSSNTYVATVSNSIVTLHAAGTTTITLIQDDTDTFRIGFATATLTVQKIAPTITFDNIYKSTGDGTFVLAPTSNSAGLFTFTATGSSVVTINGSTATITGAGTATITATQAENGNYTSGTKTATLTVTE